MVGQFAGERVDLKKKVRFSFFIMGGTIPSTTTTTYYLVLSLLLLPMNVYLVFLKCLLLLLLLLLPRSRRILNLVATVEVVLLLRLPRRLIFQSFLLRRSFPCFISL